MDFWSMNNTKRNTFQIHYLFSDRVFWKLRTENWLRAAGVLTVIYAIHFWRCSTLICVSQGVEYFFCFVLELDSVKLCDARLRKFKFSKMFVYLIIVDLISTANFHLINCRKNCVFTDIKLKIFNYYQHNSMVFFLQF